jgi:hypothetical protein
VGRFSNLLIGLSADTIGDLRFVAGVTEIGIDIREAIAYDAEGRELGRQDLGWTPPTHPGNQNTPENGWVGRIRVHGGGPKRWGAGLDGR